MTKRHTSQNKKQRLGQFFTTNCENILSGFESIVKNKDVVDPFVGNGDLLKWATTNGAKTISGFDLHPILPESVENDSLKTPPNYVGKFIVTNPPYLAANKTKGNKSIFKQWDASDYYKCHLASLTDCEEALEILPSNFLCESFTKARKKLFETHHIICAKFWTHPVFEDATTGICVVHLKKGKKDKQNFECNILPENRITNLVLEEPTFLHGKEFFKYLESGIEIPCVKTDIGMSAPNTNIIVGLLDHGRYRLGLTYNNNAPLYCRPKSFTTYQLTLPTMVLNTDQQKRAIQIFNERLDEYRAQYDGMFLSNYMGATQKILSRKYVQRLLGAVFVELNYISNPPIGPIDTLFD